MSEGGGYAYPNESNDSDRRDVLKNKLDIRSNHSLDEAEYRATSEKRIAIELGQGPQGNFDATHLKAIHKFLFEDIYEWAGYTRNDRPIVDGQQVEAIAVMRKEGNSFLHGSRIETGLVEALRPIRDPDVLRGSTVEQFAEIAGRVKADINYVHPFREGNGRTQEAFITELGRRYGHDVDFTVITKPRMMSASIESAADPKSPAMRDVIEDAIDPGRRAALKASFAHLQALGHEPFEHNIRTGRPGETIAGSLVGTDDRSASLVTDKGVIVVPRADMPARAVAIGDDVTVTVRSPYQAAGMDRTAPAVQQQDKTAAYWTRAVESGRAIQATERGNRQGYDADRSQDQSPAQGR